MGMQGASRSDLKEYKPQTLPRGAEPRLPHVVKQETSGWPLHPPLDVGWASSHVCSLEWLRVGGGGTKTRLPPAHLEPGGR